MSNGQVSLLIVDDHDNWRLGLVTALRAYSAEMALAYAGSDVNEAIRAASTQDGAILALIDAHAPDGSADVVGVHGLREAGIPVAVMSAHIEPEVLTALVKAGAFGCVLKSDLMDCLAEIIAVAPTNQEYVNTTLSASLLTTAAAHALSDSQRQVMQWHAAGVPLDIALQSQGLAAGEYATIIGGLVGALRVPDHGTDT
jgi:DNA-binding NarL/FixJ family response regulator